MANKHKTRWVLIVVAVAVAISVALSLRTDRSVTTSSDQAYNFYLAGMENAQRLYNKEAVEDFEAAIRLDSSFASAWAEVSKYYCTMGQKEEGKLAAKRALELSEKLPERERLSIYITTAECRDDFNNYEKYIDRMLERYPEEIEPHFLKAGLYWKHGKLHEAIAGFENVLEINPNYALAYNNLGYLYAQLGEYARAIEYLKKYVFIAPDQANPHDSLGEIYIMIGRYNEALEQFDRAIALKPDLAVEPGNLGIMIQIHMAQALARKGRLKNAAERLQRALDLSIGPWVERDVVLERVRMLSAQKQYAAAVDIINDLKKNSKCDADINVNLAMLYCEIGQPQKIESLIEENRTCLQETVTKCLGDSIAITEEILADHLQTCDSCRRLSRIEAYLVATANYGLGHYQIALNQVKALQDEEVFFEPRMWLQYYSAKTYFKMGEYERSLETLAPIIKVNPNMYQFSILRTRALIKSGAVQEAQRTLQDFLLVTAEADSDWVPRQEAMSLLAELDRDS